MTLRPYKFIVQAVIQQVEDGAVTGEVTSEPVTVFGCSELAVWAEKFPDKLAEFQQPG